MQNQSDKIIKKVTKSGKVKKIIKRAPKVKKAAFIVVFSLMSLIILMAYLDWTNVFGVTFFDDLYKTIQTATIGDTPIFFYLLGSVNLSGEYSFTAFGAWSFFSVIAVLFTGSFILKIMYLVEIKFPAICLVKNIV